MHIPLNYLTPLLAATPLGDLSEAELLRLYPALARGCAALMLLGLVCDGALLVWLVRTWRARRESGHVLLNVPPKPWNLPDLAIVSATLLVLMVTGSGTMALAALIFHWNDATSQTVMLLGELVMRIAAVGGLFWFVRQRLGRGPAALDLPGSSPRRALLSGIFFYLAILPPLGAVFALTAYACERLGIKPSAQPVVDLFLTSESLWVVALLVGFALVAAPMFEEIFFRGFAYPALKQRWGAGCALPLVAIVFAVAHLHGPSIAPLFALGLGLGLAYELTGSLLTSITMHALFNAGSVAMLLYVRIHQ